jgi:hypothetical protein
METDASTKRILIETNVIDGNVAETFTFSQAETLHLDFVAYTANQKRIKMPEGGSCKMEAWIDGTPATLYVQKTGTVNTTTRKATVTLSRAESNMPVGDYLFTVKVFDSDDLLTGIIARGTMTALYSPDRLIAWIMLALRPPYPPTHQPTRQARKRPSNRRRRRPGGNGDCGGLGGEGGRQCGCEADPYTKHRPNAKRRERIYATKYNW